MHQLGHTRSAHCADHLLQTPDTFVRAPIPQVDGGLAIVHAAPARGARFVQYTAELEANGALQPVETQRFLYVLEGALDGLPAGHYAYAPAGADKTFRAATACRIAVIEKEYVPLAGVEPPQFFTGSECSVPSEPLGGNPKLQVRCLLPSTPAFDFAVNTMTFEPGASLPMVEIHVMEHGLLMLQGGGIYRLGDRWYPVAAGDFIWMAPHCPQWFGALGDTPARYLIYKDWNR